MFYSRIHRHVCLAIVGLSICQAFVTSSRFGTNPFVRGGAAAASSVPSSSSSSASLDGTHHGPDDRRVVGPLGVLRAPPRSRKGMGEDLEGDAPNSNNINNNNNNNFNNHMINSNSNHINGRSSSVTTTTTLNGSKNVVRVPTSAMYHNSNHPNQPKKMNGKAPQDYGEDNYHNDDNDEEDGTTAFRSQTVEYVAETKLPTDVGAFQLRGYRIPGAPVGQEPCVIYCRDKPPFGQKDAMAQSVPVRIHDQCLTSEVFRSQRCDCKEQLNMALRYIQKHGGFIIYLQQEGRGIGLANKIAAYALQDVGFDTVDANLHLGFAEDCREYGVVKSILEDMKVGSIHLMTNNPRKVHKLTQLGINVERTLPMVVPATNPYNFKYMETKEKRMNHANLSTLLAQDPEVVEKKMRYNGVAPLVDVPHLANEYINNGTEMSANAVQVSLMVEEDGDTDTEASTPTGQEEGVSAKEDGYCFGRQSVEDAIAAIRKGEMVVVVDDMDRENEGDFIMAADACTDLDMARIVRYSSGVVCIALEEDRLKELELPPMVTNNQDPKGTAFTVTVDATKEHGITTGISASDRATTVRLLADPHSKPTDFHRPGHIFPLRAREGGVLTRDGHTEAAIDLSRLAGRAPAGILCEIVSEDNPTEMMRLPEIRRFCKRHGFILTSIADLQQYRRDTENIPPTSTFVLPRDTTESL